MLRQINVPAVTTSRGDLDHVHDDFALQLRDCQRIDPMGREFHARCPVCGVWALVLRVAGREKQIHCELGCSFAQIAARFPTKLGKLLRPGDPRTVWAYHRAYSQISYICTIHFDLERLTNRRNTWRGLPPGTEGIARRVIADAYERAGAQQTLACSLGLLEVIRRELRTKAIRLKHFWWADNLPACNPSVIDCLDESIEGRFTEFLRKDRVGIIHVDPRSQASLIALAACTWPQELIAIVVADRAEAASLQEQLRQWIPLVCVAGPGIDTLNQRIVIVDVNRITASEIHWRQRRLLFVTSLRLLARQYVYDTLLEKAPCRLYGFSARPSVQPAFVRDCVRTLLGFSEISLYRHTTSSPYVRVETVCSRGGVHIPGRHTPSEIKRYAVWNHGGRNRFILRLAGQLAANPSNSTDGVAPVPVGILLEGGSHESSLIFLHLERKRDRLPQLIRFSDLCTTPSPRFLIRADAGAGVPDDLESAIDAAPHQVTLVDIVDRHHPLLKKWARSRLNAYLDLGWALNGKVVDQVGEYLFDRPSGRTGK